MSIREFKQLARARAIVKDELSKIKLEEDKVHPSLVQVEYAVQLNDELFNEEKRKLRINLNKVMTAAQADEILNDPQIITKQNIVILNRSWDKFIQGVTKDFSNLTFETFRTILKTFLERISEPNDQRAKLNKLAEIIDILRNQAMRIDGIAPKVEKLVDMLTKQYDVPIDTLDQITQTLETVDVSKKDLDDIFKKIVDTSSPATDTNLTQMFSKTDDVNPEVKQYYDNYLKRQDYASNVSKRITQNALRNVEEEMLYDTQSLYSGIQPGASSASTGTANLPNLPPYQSSMYSEDEIRQLIGIKKAPAAIYSVAKAIFGTDQPTERAEEIFNQLGLSQKEMTQIQDAARNLGPATTKPKPNLELMSELAPYITRFRNFTAEQLKMKGSVDKDGNNIDYSKNIPLLKQKVEEISKATFGLGIKKDNRTRKETTTPFGVLQINLDKLKQNKLKLTYNNNNMVKEIKLSDISNDFKKMVEDILNKKKFSEVKYNKLSDDEKLMYKVMLKKSRVAGDIDVRLDSLGTPSIEKLKNEWEVINGQIMAGNNNATLVKRAKQIIQEFINKKIITKAQGVDILMNL